MENEQLIPVNQLCVHYEIEVSFLDELSETGLLELTPLNDVLCLHENQIVALERMIHLRYDLDINVSGIDVITNLLHRIDEMQAEINTLKNRLTLYT